MAVLELIKREFQRDQPLRGLRISVCCHVTAETANFIGTLAAGAADVRLAASNPLSTQDEVAAAIVTKMGIPVFGVSGESDSMYRVHLERVLEHAPDIIVDDGGDLIAHLHQHRMDLCSRVMGATEQTTSGVARVEALARTGRLEFPVFAVNDAKTKHMFDNRYGTAQSALDGILRSTNVLLAGKQVTIAGYGWCGRGLASRAEGLGCIVTITEVDAIRALEALMDGYRVMPMKDAVRTADIVVTATGTANVLDEKHFREMKSGAILANAGHSDVEINVDALKGLSDSVLEVRPHVREYRLRGGVAVVLLAEGRVVNLTAAEGHPGSVMDLTFANHALCVQLLASKARHWEPALHAVPQSIDNRIADLKLRSMGVEIDQLDAFQECYRLSWCHDRLL